MAFFFSPDRKHSSANMDTFAYEEQGLLHEMFSRQAQLTPNKIAVVSPRENKQLTYKELDCLTDLLAMHFQHYGVTTDRIVGIYMEKCINYTITYIAALKAGGAYMPMDVSYPHHLVNDILLDAEPKIVCVEPSLANSLPDGQAKLVMDSNWVEEVKNLHHPAYSLPTSTNLDSLAYVVYSSGTTGKPKGIQCPHRGSVFSYHHRHLFAPYTEKDNKEACNIFFTWEMMRPLLKGATMFVIPDSVIYDPKLLCQFLEEHAISRMLFTPSLLEALLEAGIDNLTHALRHMRVIIFCGEVVTTGLLERCMKSLPSIQFLNLYSISEAHDVMIGDLTAWYQNHKDDMSDRKFCPVGKLLPTVQVVILSEELEPQPVGVPGEIYIGGPTLARGYLNRPELDKLRFIGRPEGVSARIPPRLYKAGDWGYLLSDGSFEICGRCDSMVKIRGYSIETQAVEAALLSLPTVKACVVLVDGAEGEEKTLVAYIVPEDASVSKRDVRAALKTRLPFYMIPSYFVCLESIPLLPASGKLDKKALPPIDKSLNIDPEGLPSTETEKKLAPLWAETLNLKTVDIHESFFDLGGHSLLATKLLYKVKEVFGVEFTVRDLFSHSSVGAMAKVIDSCQTGTASISSPLVEVNLLEEVKTHDLPPSSLEILLRAYWRGMHYGSRKSNKAQVLLTGATGFLGAFLLRDLLLKTRCHVYCLIRESPTMKSKDRLKETLHQYGLLRMDGAGAVDDNLFESRVTCIEGDVALINMGMSDDDYTYFCSEIDIVIHAAAYVNLIYPYQALYAPNVLGTQNIIKFSWTNKIKPLHYISTDAVFPSGEQLCSENTDMSQYGDKLKDGYSQTKWVAEQLVFNASSRGLPSAIYRLGNLSGDSEHGYWNSQDFNLLMIQGCLLAGMAPKIAWDVEMTPVDFVSDFVINMVQQKTSLAFGQVFHLINCNPISSQWLFEWVHAHGFPLQMVSFDAWKEKIHELSKENAGSTPLLARLLDGMVKDESFFCESCSYTQDFTEEILEKIDKVYPKISNSLLSHYFDGLAKRRLIPRARKVTALDRPLQGKVVIVTGASSGIGEAIAKHLAGAGALVAMAARRLEKLESIQRDIQSAGGFSIAIKCDVTDRSQVGEMVRRTETTFGPVDILVNNAGLMYYTMMKNLKEDEWMKQIDINCKAPLHCVGAVLDSMLNRQSGHIVNITSDAARRGFAGLAVYSATKFFLEGFSQAMRCELAKTGVKVTTIQPGDVQTELFTHTTDNEAREAYDGSSSTKILEPDDIGRAVLYAVSQPPHASVNEILIEPREAPI